MHIGIITVRDKTFHPTRRLIKAAGDKGHHVTLIHPYRLWPVIADNTLRTTAATSYAPFDVILPRQGAQIGWSSRVLINQLRLMGIPLVNDLDAIRLTSNQFLTLQVLAQAGIPVPDTLFINAPDSLDEMPGFLTERPVVVKQINGHQGSGVALARSRAELEHLVNTRLDKTQGLLLQQYLAPAGRQDIRALVIGGKIAGAMRLTPPKGEFRANYHLGASSRAHDLSAAAARVALAAAEAVGLDIAGVDLIIDAEERVFVIEINYSPGFKGLEAATGLDIAGLIIDYAAGFAECDH